MRFVLATGLLTASLVSSAHAQSLSSNRPVQQKGVPALKQLPPKQWVPTGPAITPVPVGTFLVGGSDNCATADAISGPGTFSVDNTAATSGSPIGACGGMGNDVWFRWTATASGVATISTCGGVAADSVIGIWADAGAGVCPTTALACLDDFCGLQTQLTFGVSSGTSYLLELGGFFGATYSGSFTMTISAPTADDSCATPVVISGAGPFSFDTTAASTGAEGQSEALCFAAGSSAIYNDVWRRWTSSFTGTARISSCGGTFFDNRIAVYNGSGCPTAAAIACNDDSCGLVSQVDAAVTAGATYTIQIGSYSAAASGAGSFTINQFVPATNDDCTLPVNVVGNGPHNFDTTTATTGSQGQSEPLCLAFGTTSIFNDVWFTWTATATSQFELTLCGGGVGYDSRVAVYPGAGCPTSAAIACNDDSCGLVSALCFSATSGAQYTIQIGGYSSVGSGGGTWLLVPSSGGPVACNDQDDGSSENSIGLTAGGVMCWMVGYGTPAAPTSVSSIEVCFGTPLFPGAYVPQGPVTVAVWEDPNDDGNPSDCTLVNSTTATISAGSLDSDVFQTIALSGNVNGLFFIGAYVTHNAQEFPGPLDQSGGGSICGGGAGGSWVVGSTTGIFNANTLTANDVPPQTIASAGLPGNWLVRVNCGATSTANPYCFGDGSTTACPCGNNSAVGGNAGCLYGVQIPGGGVVPSANGGKLTATGNPSVSGDTVTLTGSQLPSAPGLYYQGTTSLATVFGDGLRCVGGTIIRLGIKQNPGGTSQYPAAGDLSVSVRGLIPAAGGQRFYQLWFRNTAAFCTPSGFNLTNGLSILWQP